MPSENSVNIYYHYCCWYYTFIIRNSRNTNEFQVSCSVATAGKGIIHLPPRTHLHFLHLPTWDHISPIFEDPPSYLTTCSWSPLKNMFPIHFAMVPKYCLGRSCSFQVASFKLSVKREKKFILWGSHSLNKYSLSTYCAQGTVLGAEDTAVNGGDKVIVLDELIS